MSRCFSPRLSPSRRRLGSISLSLSFQPEISLRPSCRRQILSKSQPLSQDYPPKCPPPSRLITSARLGKRCRNQRGSSRFTSSCPMARHSPSTSVLTRPHFRERTCSSFTVYG